MSIDLTSFNPKNTSELTRALTEEISSLAEAWWKNNSSVVRGYIRSLAHASMQTVAAFAAGKISKREAEIILEMQRNAFGTSIKFGQFMTLVLAQQILDRATAIIVAAIKNRTGISVLF